jgi:hypothetical protein
MPSSEELWPAVVSVESSGNPYAVSPKGAIGLAQITPALAAHYGVPAKDLTNPATQKWLYDAHMGYLLRKYHGDERMALAAWNAGETNVDRGIFPAETRAYVPKVLSRVPGATMADSGAPQYKYSPSRNQFGMVNPDGSITPVPTDQVPADVRARYLPKSASSTPPAAATPPAAPSGPPSLEQRYEHAFTKLPGAAQYVAPGTIGEAAGTAGNVAALALAPETGGLSLALPIGAAMVGGYMEPSDKPYLSGERLFRAGVEGAKEAGGMLGGKLLGKGFELAGRYTGRSGMLERTTRRIGQGVMDLFNEFPLSSAPKTIDEMTEKIANGDLERSAGKQLGNFRDDLINKIKEYKPAEPAEAKLYGKAGKAATGEKFTLPDVDSAQHTIVMKDFSIGDAIDHIRRMNALSYGTTGVEKSAQDSWLYRVAGHDGRDALKERLNQISKPLGEKWGDRYGQLSGDYGTSVILEDAFKGARRTTFSGGKLKGVIDQPTLMKRIDKEMPFLTRLQDPAKANAFQRAVAPDLAAAIPEVGAREPRGGVIDMLSRLVGIPYMPETRSVMPIIPRALSSRYVTRPLATPISRTLGQFAGDQPEEEQP